MKNSIINSSTLSTHEDWRWDSEYLCFEPKYKKNLVYKKISDVISESTYGLSKSMNEDFIGYKIYRMNEITDMLCDRSISKSANVNFNEAKNFFLKDGDILFNRTNSQEHVGRTGIFKKFNNEELIFASYLIRIRTKTDIILPEYLTTFLNTPFGISDAKRRARISINQSNINAEELKRIKIPLIPMRVQKKIKLLFDKSMELIKASEKIYNDTEKLILKKIKLEKWKNYHSLSFSKDSSDVFKHNRLDAEFYQPKYDVIEKIISSNSDGYVKVADYFDINKSQFKKNANQIYKYIEIGDIDIIDGSYTFNEIMGNDLPANAKIKLKQNDIVISKVRPYRGAIGIIYDKEFIGSGAFTVLHEKKRDLYSKELLFIFLRSKPILDYILKFNTGTSYPTIKDDDIMNLYIPIFKKDFIKKINTNIDKANQKKIMSKKILNQAKDIVKKIIM